jgi:hypothetical protein
MGGNLLGNSIRNHHKAALFSTGNKNQEVDQKVGVNNFLSQSIPQPNDYEDKDYLAVPQIGIGSSHYGNKIFNPNVSHLKLKDISSLIKSDAEDDEWAEMHQKAKKKRAEK